MVKIAIPGWVCEITEEEKKELAFNPLFIEIIANVTEKL